MLSKRYESTEVELHVLSGKCSQISEREWDWLLNVTCNDTLVICDGTLMRRRTEEVGTTDRLLTS